MKFWTDKAGKELTFKEFMQRWKQGIQQVALTMPKQEQIKKQIRFTWIMLIGFCLGIAISIYHFKTIGWVIIVLLGAIGNTGVQLIALYQQKKMFDNFEQFDIFKTIKSEEEQDVRIS